MKRDKFGRPIEEHEYVVYAFISGEAKFYVEATSKKEAINKIFKGLEFDSKLQDYYPVKPSKAQAERI